MLYEYFVDSTQKQQNCRKDWGWTKDKKEIYSFWISTELSGSVMDSGVGNDHLVGIKLLITL